MKYLMVIRTTADAEVAVVVVARFTAIRNAAQFAVFLVSLASLAVSRTF